MKDAPQWKRSLFNSWTDLCWARVAQTPDDTDHLWRGLFHGDISLCISHDVLETPIDSEEQLRQLRLDIKNFLQSLAYAHRTCSQLEAVCITLSPPSNDAGFHHADATATNPTITGQASPRSAQGQSTHSSSFFLSHTTSFTSFHLPPSLV
jgi:hypothetical protein